MQQTSKAFCTFSPAPDGTCEVAVESGSVVLRKIYPDSEAAYSEGVTLDLAAEHGWIGTQEHKVPFRTSHMGAIFVDLSALKRMGFQDANLEAAPS